MAENQSFSSGVSSSAEATSSPGVAAGIEFESNPNQRLSSVLLNEFNYLPWSRAITLALGGRSKLSFIDDQAFIPDASSQDYATWLSKDQLVRSWILNSMDPQLAEIFSYSDSAAQLWMAVRDMYGQQNNYARIFELQRDIVNLQQSGKPFVQLLGSLKKMWNELEVYRPHTVDAAVLRKRVEEDKIFQLLASLGSDYEDLRSHILMSPELPSFSSICSTIQREEVRRKVMKVEHKSPLSDTRAYATNHQPKRETYYKGKRPDLKCDHCHHLGHLIERCWVLHPELKPKFAKDKGPSKHRAHVTETLQGDMVNYNSNPISLINEFAAYLQQKGDKDLSNPANSNSTAFLGKFAGLLANSERSSHGNNEGISTALSTALKFSTVHDFWIVDSGATDHMTNKLTNLFDFKKFSTPSHVSVANGYGVPVIGSGKLKDLVTKKTIGEGFFLQGNNIAGSGLPVLPNSPSTAADRSSNPISSVSADRDTDQSANSPSDTNAIHSDCSQVYSSNCSQDESSPVGSLSPMCQDVPQPRRYPTRNHAPPKKLQDFVTYSVCHPTSRPSNFKGTSFWVSAIVLLDEPHFQENKEEIF
ncbi:hypothetical protein L6164_006700 [Bauhinia variegata]|uniref:Uncharacterized protein n=1 Tax=Bauhinia variegata TaxID=167791 RepID=A0ACB9PUL5_BAUVA|nr:hypothetical protein L6164_006700 [Bauhinia variegata]